MITDVAGVRVGHWTNEGARTGCTVVLFPPGTVGSGEVRGGAPATREFALLDPQRLVQHVDAVVLSGGSAFGLAAADGVMRYLEEQGAGFVTPMGPVPIVIGLSLFDLAVGDRAVRPTAEDGYRACGAATTGRFDTGAIGAGTGATVDKWRGAGHRRPAGLGTSTVQARGVTVSALVAVNAFGRIDDRLGDAELDASLLEPDESAFGNTIVGVVATDARLDKPACHVVAQGGHDGVARAVFPPHTRVDGDALVVGATQEVDAPVDLVRAMAVLAVERAVRAAGGAYGMGEPDRQ